MPLRLPACAVLLTALAALASAPALAESTSVLTRFPSSGLDQPAGSASLTDGPNALSVNPAGLGFQRGFSLFYLHETGPEPGRELASSSGDGLYLGDRFFGVLGLGFGVEWMRPKVGVSRPELHYRRTNWGLSLGGDVLSLGAVAHVFTHGVMDNHTSWDLGVMARPDRYVSLGFTIRDVGAPSAAGAPLPRHYVASIGARPFGDWLTLAVDGEVLGGENDRIDNGFGAMALGYTALARVIPGLTVFSSLTHRIEGGTPLVIQGGLSVDVDGLGVFGTPLIRTRDGDAGFLLGATLRAYDVPSLDLAPRRRVVKVDLDKALSPASELRLFSGTSRDPLVDLVAGLEDLARDDRVGGVILEVRSPELGLGKAYEVRRALETFRATSGKKVGVLLYGADDASYFMATVADRIWSTPDAALFINGFSSEAAFFGGTLEMIGVSVDVARVGKYKNAPDAFTRRDASPAQREVVTSALDDIYPRYVDDVSSARGLDPAAFRAAVDQGILTPKEAEALGLVDGVIYPDELEKRASELLGAPALVEKGTLEPEAWTSWGPATEIAVIPIEGTITAGHSGGAGFVRTTGARSVVDYLQKAAADPQVRAIVLPIDSPGGDAGGSQLIWRAVLEARKKKPVIASMSDVAASGGYFAAVGADRIFAAPDTITGSIGIFWIKPSLEGLLKKLEIGQLREKRGAQADINDVTIPWTPQEQASVQRYVDSFYEIFVSSCAEGRGLAYDEVNEVAQGRVWTGAQAKERRLVDELGGLSDALAAAKVAGGLRSDARVRYRVYKPAAGILRTDDSGAMSVDLRPSVELPEPLRSAILAKIPAPLLVSNPSGLWAIAPFDWKPR